MRSWRCSTGGPRSGSRPGWAVRLTGSAQDWQRGRSRCRCGRGWPHGELTLEQAAAIEEFAGDAKAYARLLRAAEYPPGLHYSLADERAKRAVAERKETTRVALRDAGVRIIAKPKNFPWTSVEPASPISTTTRAPTSPTRRTAPARGTRPSSTTRASRCTSAMHPKDWGHGTPPDYRHRSKTELAEAEEAAEARREYQHALAVADEARASFLTDYLARKGKAPAGTLRTALHMLARADRIGTHPSGGPRSCCSPPAKTGRGTATRPGRR